MKLPAMICCRCRFVGIDVSSSFLEEAACNLMLQVEGQLSVDMVEGDYLDGLRQVREKYPDDPLCLLWLGSSVGNLRAAEAISFFKDVVNAVDYRCRIFVAAGRSPIYALSVSCPLKFSTMSWCPFNSQPP